MKRCPKCFGSIRRMGHIEKPFYCPECKEWFSNEEVTPKPTNADRIRSMSDTELEEWLTAFVCSNVSPHATARGAAKKGRLLEWLKHEGE